MSEPQQTNAKVCLECFHLKCAAVMAKVEAMKAANYQCLLAGIPPKYTEEHFMAESYLLTAMANVLEREVVKK